MLPYFNDCQRKQPLPKAMCKQEMDVANIFPYWTMEVSTQNPILHTQVDTSEPISKLFSEMSYDDLWHDARWMKSCHTCEDPNL